jgi:hypothetical protein
MAKIVSPQSRRSMMRRRSDDEADEREEATVSMGGTKVDSHRYHISGKYSLDQSIPAGRIYLNGDIVVDRSVLSCRSTFSGSFVSEISQRSRNGCSNRPPTRTETCGCDRIIEWPDG